MDVARRLLAAAMLDVRNSHFVLLCESSIPLFDFPFTFNYITNQSNAYSYVDSSPGDPEYWTPELLPLVPKSEWRVGQPWWTLQRKHAAILLADVAHYHRFQQPNLNLTAVSEQHYYATVLGNQGLRDIVPRTLMFQRWRHPPGQRDAYSQPRTIHSWDATQGFLLDASGAQCLWDGTIRMPCFLFARKMGNDTASALLPILPVRTVDVSP